MSEDQEHNAAGSGGLQNSSRVAGRYRRGLLFIAATGLSLALLAIYGRGDRPSLSTSGSPQLASGLAIDPAPDYTFTTFDGQRLGPTELAGKAVVLNFWASWCTPCRAEMPYFETTYQMFRERDLVFVGLAVQDAPASAQAFLEELGITYPAGLDEGNEITVRYQVSGLPTTIFIDRDGNILRRWTGPISEKQLIDLVAQISQ